MAGGDSIIYNGPDQFYAFRFAQNNAHLFGAECNLDIHPHPLDWLHIENSFSFVRGMLSQEQDGSKNLPFIPGARLLNEVKVELLKDGKTLRNFILKRSWTIHFRNAMPLPVLTRKPIQLAIPC